MRFHCEEWQQVLRDEMLEQNTNTAVLDRTNWIWSNFFCGRTNFISKTVYESHLTYTSTSDFISNMGCESYRYDLPLCCPLTVDTPFVFTSYILFTNLIHCINRSTVVLQRQRGVHLFRSTIPSLREMFTAATGGVRQIIPDASSTATPKSTIPPAPSSLSRTENLPTPPSSPGQAARIA